MRDPGDEVDGNGITLIIFCRDRSDHMELSLMCFCCKREHVSSLMKRYITWQLTLEGPLN